MRKICRSCGKPILTDSRNYEKRLAGFQAATGDNGDFCDDCMTDARRSVIADVLGIYPITNKIERYFAQAKRR